MKLLFSHYKYFIFISYYLPILSRMYWWIQRVASVIKGIRLRWGWGKWYSPRCSSRSCSCRIKWRSMRDCWMWRRWVKRVGCWVGKWVSPRLESCGGSCCCRGRYGPSKNSGSRGLVGCGFDRRSRSRIFLTG